MILREHYIKEVRPFYDTDLVKIITGIRRSGKSVILGQIMTELKTRTSNIIYLNFEDKRVATSIKDAEDLLDYIEEHSTKEKWYLFFDEIQELKDWQAACKTLRLYNYSIFITGSNSKLLSSEFTQELSGRYVAFRVRPFVYKEIVAYAKELGKKANLIEYLVWGGFPQRVEFDEETAIKRYISDLDDTIVINDLIRRNNIRKTTLFRALVDYVLRSNSRIFSIKSIHNYIKQENDRCSINTIIKYMEYLEQAYIIESVKQYSAKVKRNLKYYQKIYNEDVSLNSIRCLDNKYDITHNLENIIYNELVYRGYEINVYDNGGKEIDFRASKNGKVYYVQVAYSVAEEKTYQREFAAFKSIDNLAQKILITNDEVDYSTSVVRHIKVKDFLEMEEL